MALQLMQIHSLPSKPETQCDILQNRSVHSQDDHTELQRGVNTCLKLHQATQIQSSKFQG